jgi:hypothetical protein
MMNRMTPQLRFYTDFAMSEASCAGFRGFEGQLQEYLFADMML